MNVSASIELYAGGPGSGCNPAVGKCGRPAQEKLLKDYLPQLKAPTKPLKQGESTEQAWRDSKTGQWDPARAAFHQRVVSLLLAGKVRYTGQPQVTLLGGGTASGKTTASRRIIGDDPNVLRVDQDELKTVIPEYEGLKKTDPQNASLRVHEESSYLTKLAMAEAAAKGLDIVYDATTAGNGGPNMARNLSQKGYQVRAMFFDVPIDEARQRSARRAANSTDPINFGRHVPDDVIVASHIGAANKFMQLKDMPEVQDKKFYDNTTGPKLVYERQGMGEEKIYDQNRWNQYREKAETGRRKELGLAAGAVARQKRSRAIRYAGGRGRVRSAV